MYLYEYDIIYNSKILVVYFKIYICGINSHLILILYYWFYILSNNKYQIIIYVCIFFLDLLFTFTVGIATDIQIDTY